MTFKLAQAAAAIWMAFGVHASAESHPVVVELFTSQGCSSCPPADALLKDYANRNDVIALAFHVDYWDYIGWKDTFASRDYSNRQKAYAHASNRSMVYTPQMIVGGDAAMNGSSATELRMVVELMADRSPEVSLSLERIGDTVQINASRLSPDLGPLDVQIIRYMPKETVSIGRGENAGRTIDYNNIVHSIDRVQKWDGEDVLSVNATAEGEDPVVVLIQRNGHGPILAAARLF